MSETTVIIHIQQDGDANYLVCGDGARVFVVDERVPNDRVYELRQRDSPETIGKVVGNERHKAIEARVRGIPFHVVSRDEGK